MNKNLKSCLLVLVVLFSTTGCATIVDGGEKFVSINVNPENAKIYVQSNKGDKFVRTGSFSLQVNRKASYTLKIELPNYESEVIQIERGLDGWVFGNIALGGIIGLVIDASTGNMWTPKPKIVNVELSSKKITSYEDLPGKVEVEMPFKLQRPDGSLETVYLPMTFYKKANHGEIA